MREWIGAKVREWYIPGIALCLIGGSLYLASPPSRPAVTVSDAPSKAVLHIARTCLIGIARPTHLAAALDDPSTRA